MADVPVRSVPSVYRGIHMRSQLEIRWAAFMDVIGIKWRYEPAEIALPDGRRHIPDFWLYGMDCYLQIKPYNGHPTEPEHVKNAALAAVTGYHAFLFSGLPYRQKGFLHLPAGGQIDSVKVGICDICGRPNFTFANTSNVGCFHASSQVNYSHPRLIAGMSLAVWLKFDERHRAMVKVDRDNEYRLGEA